MTENNPLSDLIKIALSEVGYLEKASNASLEDKTANVGKANYTKYGAWYGINPGAWCAMFISWCADRAGAADVIPRHSSCSAGISAFKKLGRWYQRNGYTPRQGDIIYFCDKNGAPCHVGIVTKVTASRVYTVEGNTGSGNTVIANGGAVATKDYGRDYYRILGYGNPKWPEEETGGKQTMNTVKGSTDNENKLIITTQEGIGSEVDGEAGIQYFTDVACKLNIDCFPLTVKIWGAPVIIADDIIPFSAGGATLSDYRNTINGSFYAGERPCSILVQDGITQHAEACHIYYDKPESVLYRTVAGEMGIMRVKTVKELPKCLLWAVGGCGLLSNYDPKAEGFCVCTKGNKTENFSDVINANNHAMLGVKNRHLYLVYCANMTGNQVNAFAKKLRLEMAILMDGGHVAGINGTETFAKINTKEKQYYMIQGVRRHG